MKEKRYKTKDVADLLDVSKGTVLKWVKKYDVPCSVNQYGHYCFDEKHLALFLDIKEKNRQVVSAAQKKEPPVSTYVLTDKITNMEENIKILERMVSNKADEVVSYQLMEHRKEVRSLNKQLQKIEERLDRLEDQKQTLENTEFSAHYKRDKRVLASLFSALKIT
ncbi:helix-turn-helix domain-containing protein [Alteribacillus sp. JSM 102045]|uniref:helix-turn-helix domain-containing protein n=1 Tax=Alteribacillus sp. JSM 102045 TaxID=1562101 RepID=UPI0035C1576C